MTLADCIDNGRRWWQAVSTSSAAAKKPVQRGNIQAASTETRPSPGGFAAAVHNSRPLAAPSAAGRVGSPLLNTDAAGDSLPATDGLAVEPQVGWVQSPASSRAVEATEAITSACGAQPTTNVCASCAAGEHNPDVDRCTCCGAFLGDDYFAPFRQIGASA